MPYTGVTSLAAKQVCLGLEKRATCTDFLTLYFLLQIFATCNNLICCQTGLKVASWTRIRSTATLQNKLLFFVARFTVPKRFSATSPVCLDREGLGKCHTEARQQPSLSLGRFVIELQC